MKNYIGVIIYSVLTLTYVLLTTIVERDPFLGGLSLPTAFLGLFVPAGVMVTMVSLGTIPIILFIFFYILDRWFLFNQFSIKKRIFIVLTTLFTLTMFVDLLITGDLTSLINFSFSF